MPTFRYKAYTQGGKVVAGDIEAAGLGDALVRLKTTGLFPTDVEEAELEKGRLIKRKVTAGLLAVTTRQLATLVSTGTTISDALSVLIENSTNLKLKSVLIKVKEDVSGGSSFAKALEPHPDIFSTFYRGLVAAAEATGSLDKMLPKVADYLEARARIMNEVRTALTYPALMSLVGAGVLSFLFVYVIPKITSIFADTQSTLPLITQVLLFITGAFLKLWPALLAGLAASVWYARRSLKTERGKAFRDRWLLRLPWLGPIAVDFYISNFARTMGSLLKGGVQMLKALDITREVMDHAVYGEALKSARKDCMEGASLSASLKKSGVVPSIVVHMINVGERSGQLDEMLLKAAESYELSFQAGVKKTLSLLEPVLILVMGVVVGFIVLAILLPIFQLSQTIR